MTDRVQPEDVRLRGFSRRALVEDALAWLDAHTERLETETVALSAGHGRVSAAAVMAPGDLPPCDCAAVDGYALRGVETAGASAYNPLPFRVQGEALPGRPFATAATPGAAVRISTGAPLPAGADAVLAAEYAVSDLTHIEVTTAIAPGDHINRRGSDFRQGDPVLPVGRRLRPHDVGLLAALGCARIAVVRRPRVRLVITGTEWTAPGQASPVIPLYEANSLMLRGLIERDGGFLESCQTVPDEPAAIQETLLAVGADIVLVSGGSGSGRKDAVPNVVREHGELAFHGLALRPAGSTGLGRARGMPVVLLPGNPVACLCAYECFAGRAIRRLGGRAGDWPHPRRQVRVARKIVSGIGMVDYYRVRLSDQGVVPLTAGSAALWSSVTRADGFVIVPGSSEGYPPGAEVTVYCFDP